MIVESQYVAPRWQLGYLSPLAVVDAMHYEFYQMVPGGGNFVSAPLLIQAFDAASARDAIVNRSAEAIDYLAGRGADRIIFGGVPVASLAGRQTMLAIMQEAQQRTGIAIGSDLEDSIEAMRHLGLRRVAVAAKWKPPVMDAVAAYLRDAGIEATSLHGDDFDAASVMQVDTARSLPLALQLGRAALAADSRAEGLFLGGGTWLALQATQILEADFAKPVVSNMVAQVWSTLQLLGGERSPAARCMLMP
jgi:arylmalonate decarboxylase